MDMILLYSSNGIVILGFILYFLLIIVGSRKNVSKDSGFDITKDIISEYNSINVIETKSYFSIYNIKRRVIKLSSGCYYGRDLSSISLSLIEAGISIVDNNKNKYIDLFRNFFSNLKMLYVFGVVSIFINNSSFNVSDAKVSMIFMLIFILISYILLDIKSSGFNYVSNKLENIKETSVDKADKVIGFMNKFLWCDKLIYYGEVLMVVRMVLIMFEII